MEAPNLGTPSFKKKYKVVYDRANCIGVLSCVAFYPERWSIGSDNKADLIGGQKVEGEKLEGEKQLGSGQDQANADTWVLEFTEEELERLKSSAEVCPVNVIHIYNLETGEKMV